MRRNVFLRTLRHTLLCGNKPAFWVLGLYARRRFRIELSTDSAPAREPSDQASRDRADCRRGYAKVRPEPGLEADRYGRGYRPRQPSRKGVKNEMMLRI